LQQGVGKNDRIKTNESEKRGMSWFSRSPPRSSPADTLKQALQLIERGDLAGAEPLLHSVVDAEPSNDVALHILGLVLHQLTGDERGLEYLERAIEQNPAQATYHYDKGTVYAEQLRLNEAEDCFSRAVSLKPDHAMARNLLGEIYLSRGETRQSIECFELAIRADPGCAVAHKNLGNVFANQPGKLEESLAHFRAALRIAPRLVEARLGLAGVLKKGVALSQDGPELENDLRECFDSPVVMKKMIAYPTALHLRYKFGIDVSLSLSDKATLDLAKHLGSDPLFHLLLRQTYNVDPEFEIVLLRIRRAILFSDPNFLSDSDFWREILISIARQCFNNEFVFSSDDAQERAVGALRDAIEREAGSEKISPELERNVLLHGMYAPLYKQACAPVLQSRPLEAWSPSVRELISMTFHEPLEEENIKSTISSVGEISNPVSHKIKAQYEENPYPRWVSNPAVEPQNFTLFFRRIFPYFPLPEFLGGPIRILNAGCGTGQSPISSAMTYRNAEVLGIDLSWSSLAYAKRMALKLDIRNIGFMQGDILNLPSLKQDFHVIESVGVLHHMENPEEGWSVLTDLLIPGGVMKLGFYSEMARRDIVTARKRIAERGLMPVDEDIRAFRSRILMDQSDADLSGLFRAWDFFSLSECRDCLFHAQEHRYTLPQIKKMIADQGLVFAGFQFPDLDTKIKYQRLFPQDPGMTDLDCWDAFERQYPDTFWGMYVFWCQKKPA